MPCPPPHLPEIIQRGGAGEDNDRRPKNPSSRAGRHVPAFPSRDRARPDATGTDPPTKTFIAMKEPPVTTATPHPIVPVRRVREPVDRAAGVPAMDGAG